MDSHRKSTIRDFTVSNYDEINAGTLTHLDALTATIEMAVGLAIADPSISEEDLTSTVLEDLQDIYVGNSLVTGWGRGHGKYWYGRK